MRCAHQDLTNDIDGDVFFQNLICSLQAKECKREFKTRDIIRMLEIANSFPDIEMVKTWVESSIVHERTPLMAAVEENQGSVVHTLILLGANPHAQDAQGRSVWEMASPEMREMIDSVRALYLETHESKDNQ